MTESDLGRDPIGELIVALRQADAKVRLRRQAPSTLYDASYQVILNLLATQILTATDAEHRVLLPWLTLCQFVAARPRLLPQLETWLKTAHHNQLEFDSWSALPRGYLTDVTQSRVRDFLAARGYLRHLGSYIYRGTEWTKAAAFLAPIENQELFDTERQTLNTLKGYRVVKAMLGAK
jgi:hypothetical protein